MRINPDIKLVMESFGLIPSDYKVEVIKIGHINNTYKLAGRKSYVLQKINIDVFKNPIQISRNIRLVSDFLNKEHPDYIFLNYIDNKDKPYVIDNNGNTWRMFPFVAHSISFNTVTTVQRAYSASKEFGRLMSYLDRLDCNLLSETIPQFHDLILRYRQFEHALCDTNLERSEVATNLIAECKDNYYLVEEYSKLIENEVLEKRVTHNDCKINNILFDKTTNEAICIVDLDTLMPGYFIYDLGDMIRTFVSPVSEEEKDYSKIIFRDDIYSSILEGYLHYTKNVLKDAEIEAIPFAGKMMTYIMALRFLTDYLRGDKYYQTSYPDQNLVRAGNQMRLLDVITSALK